LERQAKRLAAAIAAVERYLQEEQQARTYVPAAAAVTSAWGLAARIEQMNVRASMQTRGRR
jgi:hypothetical protein